MPEVALKSKGLSIGYQRKKTSITIGSSLNLSLNKHKLTCLMGANGIGKSTLIKTLTGVLPPLAGNVSVGNFDIQRMSNIEMAKSISVLLTEKPSTGFMTVRDLINLGRFPYTSWRNNFNGDDEQVVENAIKSVGLTQLVDVPLSELSDGNLQKAIIGRALAQDTDIIILDEPTIHLDVNNKTVIIKLLQKLCHEHSKTILMSTHDLDLTMKYADRLWLFAENKLIDGLPEDLYLNGSLSEVFYESESSSSQNDHAKNEFNVEGDASLVALLRQAMEKSRLASGGFEKEKISISKFEFGLRIDFGNNSYLSIEEFIEALPNSKN